jgi:hypothetical protein
MKVLLSFALVLLAGSVVAENRPVEQQDFAYGLPIEVSGDASIYRMTVPEVVYRHLIKADFSDLRVFNAAGELVPHSLRWPVEAQADEGDPRVLPFFPFTLIKPGEKSPAQVQVTINEQGTVVSSSASAEVDGEEQVSAYLIDVSALEEVPSRLAFSWGNPEDNFVAHVSIQGSDDLSRWQTLVSQASLVRLYFADRELGRKEIELPRRANKYKYLKLNWPAAGKGARLTGVQAWFSQKAKPVESVWTALTGSAVEDEEAVFDYQVEGRLPVEWAEVALPEDNSLVDVRLYSRDEETLPWRKRHSGSFYRLTVDGASLASEPGRFSRVSNLFWRLEAVSDLSGLGVAVPVLRLGYTAHQLYFLARGEGPFVLAFAAEEAPGGQGQINALLARIDEKDSDTFIGEARTGEVYILGGEGKLIPAPASFPWQQVILWSVLVIGVFVLGSMAWRLGKQMK